MTLEERIEELERITGAITEAQNDKVDIATGKSQSDIDYVIERQEPTAENNYTWYRKYKSGWVEQGQSVYDLQQNTTTSVTLLIEMADTNYTGQISGHNTTFATASTLAIAPNTTTQVKLWNFNSAAHMDVNWQVWGKSAS